MVNAGNREKDINHIKKHLDAFSVRACRTPGAPTGSTRRAGAMHRSAGSGSRMWRGLRGSRRVEPDPCSTSPHSRRGREIGCVVGLQGDAKLTVHDDRSLIALQVRAALSELLCHQHSREMGGLPLVRCGTVVAGIVVAGISHSMWLSKGGQAREPVESGLASHDSAPSKAITISFLPRRILGCMAGSEWR